MDCKYSKLLDNNGLSQQVANKLTVCQQQQQVANLPLALSDSTQHFASNASRMASGYHGVNAPPTLPINDFHLLENANKYSEEEKQLRIKLAAVYRLIEMNGWSMGIYNHVTAKLEKQNDRILIHPFGLHYNEITASSLLKIDMCGNIVDQGSTNFELNRPGYIVHSAIHLARPDLKAIIHLHYPPVAAASTCKYGLLPVCQEQALLGEISYLHYNGILTQEEERDAIAAGLGQKSKIMILRNHGLIACGETIEEAFYLLQNLMRACETQARLLALNGIENLILMTEEASYQAWDMVQNCRYPIRLPACLSNENNSADRSDETTSSGNESDLEEHSDDSSLSPQPFQIQKTSQQYQQLPRKVLKKNIIGYVNMFELDFEAQMRALDLLGHETGYKYKRPLIRSYKRLV